MQMITRIDVDCTIMLCNKSTIAKHAEVEIMLQVMILIKEIDYQRSDSNLNIN
jgi:hypothetical protein